MFKQALAIMAVVALILVAVAFFGLGGKNSSPKIDLERCLSEYSTKTAAGHAYGPAIYCNMTSAHVEGFHVVQSWVGIRVVAVYDWSERTEVQLLNPEDVFIKKGTGDKVDGGFYGMNLIIDLYSGKLPHPINGEWDIRTILIPDGAKLHLLIEPILAWENGLSPE